MQYQTKTPKSLTLLGDPPGKGQLSGHYNYKLVTMSNVLIWSYKSLQEYKNAFIVSATWLSVWVIANLSLLQTLNFIR